QKSSQSASREPENTAAAVRARVLYLFCLVGFAAGYLVAGSGILFGSLGRALGGGAIFAASWTVRGWLRRRGEWDETAAAFDAISEFSTEGDERVTRLLALLQQRDELETHRGDAGFDPWALQEIRRDIQATIDRDVSLARVFHNYERQRRMS